MPSVSFKNPDWYSDCVRNQLIPFPILFPFPAHTGRLHFPFSLAFRLRLRDCLLTNGMMYNTSKPDHETPLAIFPTLFLFHDNTGSYIFKVTVSHTGRSLDPRVIAWRRIAQLYSTMRWVRNTFIACATEILRVVFLPQWRLITSANSVAVLNGEAT